MEKITVNFCCYLSLIILTFILAGCNHSKYQESSIKYDAFDDSARILITNFSINSAPSYAKQPNESIKVYSHTRQYRTSVYDITKGFKFLGTIQYLGDYQRTQWIEYPVQLGKHRLMLVSENDVVSDIEKPYYFDHTTDIIEVDVKQSPPVYVTISKQPHNEQPYFHQILFNSKHAKNCEKLPERHYSKRESAIKSYMKQNNINSNNQDFYRFCKVLSEQKLLISANKMGKSSVCTNCTQLQHARERALLQWNPDMNNERAINLID